jgi:hypothetical protein
MGTSRNDLLIGTHNPDLIYLYPNQGSGTFGVPHVIANLGPDRSFVVADFNGDGRLDIAYNGSDSSNTSGGAIHVLLNQGNGIFDDVLPAALSKGGGLLIVGDFNLDGLPDLAVETTGTTAPITLQVYVNQGQMKFNANSSLILAPVGSIPYSLVVGDFDHDNFPDIAGIGGGFPGATGPFSSVPSVMMYVWGNGIGAFAAQYVIGPAGFYAAAGDVNGDGIPDIVMPDRALSVAVALGRTDRSFPQISSMFPVVASSITAFDFNGD